MSYKYKFLKSGCKLITIPRSESRTTHIAFFVKVGSRDEVEGEFGMAHFLEHMLFKGNRSLKTQLRITNNLDKMGSDYNAYTTKNMTCYHISVASKYATRAFKTYSNMLLHSTLKQKEMRKEQRVVVEEYNKMIDNVIRYSIENVFQLIFKGTDLGRPTIGYVDSILGLTHASLNRFYRKYYKKNNMLIVVSGKIPKELSSKIYGIYGRPTNKKPTTVTKTPKLEPGIHLPIDYGLPRPLKIKVYNCPRECNMICLDQRKEVKQSNIIIAYRIPGLYDTDNFKLEVLSEYLGGGMSSILFQKIRTRLGLAYTIRTETELYEEGGVFMIYAGTDKKNTETVVSKILEEVDKLQKVLLEKRVVKECLDKITGRFIMAEENGMNLCLSYGSRALFDAKIYDNKRLTKEFTLQRMKPWMIRDTAKKYLNRENLYVSILGDHPLNITRTILK